MLRFVRLDGAAMRRTSTFFGLLLVAASAAQAQTIVPNAHLDAQLAPWSTFQSAAPDPAGSGTSPAWQPTPDRDGNPASGSALVHVNTSTPATNAASGIAQCFDFSGGATAVVFLNYGMAFRVPAVASIDGSVDATVEVRLYSGAGCTGFLSGGSQGEVLAAPNVVAGTWYRLADTGFVPAGAPVMAASVQLRGYLRQNGVAPSQSDYAIDLDQFLLVLNSTTPVGLQHFDVE